MFIWVGCTQRECHVRQAKIFWTTITELCLNPISLQELRKSYHILRNLAQAFLHGLMTWKVMQRNAWNDIANWPTEQLNSNTKSQLHALTTINSGKEKWDALENCQKFAHKLFLECLFLARIGRLGILWSVNKLARVFTKRTRACDTCSARLISYIHHTSEFKQYCHVGTTAPECRLGLFQD